MAEFVTRKENRRRLITLIVSAAFSTLSLAGGIWAIKAAGDIEDSPEKPDTIIKLRKDVNEKRDSYRTLQAGYEEFSIPVGWRMAASTSYDRLPTTGVRGTHLKSYLNAWVKELQKPGLEVRDFKPWDQEGQGNPLMLTDLFNKLSALEIDYLARNKQLETEVGQEYRTAVQAQQEIDAAQRRNLEEIDQRLKGEYQSLLKELSSKEIQHAKEIADLEVETFAAQKELNRHKNENVKEQMGLEQQLQDLRTRINWIQYRREEEKLRKEPDGIILAVDEKDRIAYIDLLRRDRIFVGTVFKVYSLEKGGVKVDKGEIEVLEIRDELSSRAAIISTLAKDDPIKAGDRIYNESYEKGKVRYFAVAGRLTGKLSNEEAARRLREVGDVYQDRVDEKTNYVVLGEGFAGPDGKFASEDEQKDDHPNFRLSREWCVKLILERNLYEYLGVK